MITRRPILWLLPAAVAATALPAMAETSRRIPLAQLEGMFASMGVKTKWNVDGPLLWGYFFFDPSEAKLQAAAKELQAAGYRVVGVQQVGAKQLFRLHVERVEAHTPISLNARNSEFYAFAEKHALASYDGMDVGPAPEVAK
jgi:hypothetical protein